MKFPKEINAYCPYCRAHKNHRAKLWSKGRARTMSAGTLAHARSLTGHGSKRAGVKTVRKQGKRQRLTLTCSACNKKQDRTVGGGRTTKKIEFKV